MAIKAKTLLVWLVVFKVGFLSWAYAHPGHGSGRKGPNQDTIYKSKTSQLGFRRDAESIFLYVYDLNLKQIAVDHVKIKARLSFGEKSKDLKLNAQKNFFKSEPLQQRPRPKQLLVHVLYRNQTDQFRIRLH